MNFIQEKAVGVKDGYLQSVNYVIGNKVRNIIMNILLTSSDLGVI